MRNNKIRQHELTRFSTLQELVEDSQFSEVDIYTEYWYRGADMNEDILNKSDYYRYTY